MDILLIGASGMIGSRVLAEAVARGHNVIAASRNPEKIAPGEQVTAVALDATDPAAVAALAKAAPVIVSAVSPRGTDDRLGKALAVGDAVMAAAGQSGARLFIIGGAGSLNTADGKPVVDTIPEEYRAEPAAMKVVFGRLQASDLNWTFFSPAAMIRPGERTGQYRLGTSTLITDAEGKSQISAEDYAKAVIDELESPKYERSQMTIGY